MSEKINVLHILTRMDYAGTETLLMNIFRCINREKIHFAFAVSTETEAPYDKEIIELGGDIYHYPKYSVKNHFAYCKWWKDFFENEGKKYQIVHGHIGSTAAIYLAIAKKVGKYTIAHSHATNDTIFSLKAVAYRLFSFKTRFVADFFMGCSKQALIDRYGKRIAEAPERSFVLNNGIDLEKFRFSKSIRFNVRKKLGYDDNKFVLGHVGRQSTEKNPMMILSVFNELYKKNSNCCLLYIGKGNMHDDILKKVSDLHLTEVIKFIEYTDCVEKYLQAMDAFIFPSFYEGLGIVSIEAQASGLPVFASDNIPKETHISNLIHYISLKEKPEFWAEEILKVNTNERIDNFEIISKSCFDIKSVTNKLERFYFDCLSS